MPPFTIGLPQPLAIAPEHADWASTMQPVTEPLRRMLVICPFPIGVAAGQRLKFEQYYDDWRAAGWQVDVAPFMDVALWRILFERGHLPRKFIGVARGYLRRVRDLLRVPAYELIYCHMYVTPLGTSFAERLLRLLARKLVFDVEDNVMSHVNRVGRDHPNALLRFIRASEKYRYLVRVADHVVASSPALSERCAELNRKGASTYVSSSLDAERFQPGGRYENDHLVTIGWTGTFSTRPYLDLIRPVLQKLAKKRRFRLRVIGNFDYQLPGVDIEVIRWSAEREVEDLGAIDIGVYPLPHDEWVSGKSGLKAIQYMMMGLPCVATGVGTTPMIIRHGENGLLASSDDEWLDALTRLIDQPDLRRRLGEAARKDAVARFSTDVIAVKYRAILSNALKD
jgi:glycosyltransferase involved in cell wall biosynthesis